jgi:hypothetical protein
MLLLRTLNITSKRIALGILILGAIPTLGGVVQHNARLRRDAQLRREEVLKILAPLEQNLSYIKPKIEALKAKLKDEPEQKAAADIGRYLDATKPSFTSDFASLLGFLMLLHWHEMSAAYVDSFSTDTKKVTNELIADYTNAEASDVVIAEARKSLTSAIEFTKVLPNVSPQQIQILLEMLDISNVYPIRPDMMAPVQFAAEYETLQGLTKEFADTLQLPNAIPIHDMELLRSSIKEPFAPNTLTNLKAFAISDQKRRIFLEQTEVKFVQDMNQVSRVKRALEATEKAFTPLQKQYEQYHAELLGLNQKIKQLDEDPYSGY